MFNFHGTTPSHRVTTRQQRHHSHRCPLFQVQRKAPTSPTPTLAAVKPPRVELPPLTPSAKTQVQRITRLYPPSSKEETRLNLNYPNYSTPTSTVPNRPQQNRKKHTVLNLTSPSKCVALLSQPSEISDKPQTKSDPNQTCHNHR